MQLTEVQSRELLLTHGVYVTGACDRCGKILGAVRYTRRDEPGEWCSELCRDGFERKGGMCLHCGVSLKGKRKGAFYCGRTCRMREGRRSSKDSQIIVNTHIQKSGLTDTISGSG